VAKETTELSFELCKELGEISPEEGQAVHVNLSGMPVFLSFPYASS